VKRVEKPLRRELVFGFVAPLGVDRDIAEKALKNALWGAPKGGGPRYVIEKIKVSEALEAFADREALREAVRDHKDLTRKRLLMNAGDDMRRDWATEIDVVRGDAGAIAAIVGIQNRREDLNKAKGVQPRERSNSQTQQLSQIPLDGVCYLVDSLKHPDELDRLRSVYGPAFVSIGIYAPKAARREKLTFDGATEATDEVLEELLTRDENAGDKLGQKVADAFYITDFIVDVIQSPKKVQADFRRLVELLFGNIQLTPSKDELGMYHARAAQARSGSLARQIGAAIVRDDGSVVATGTNEAAKPGGGQYWPDDDEKYKGRDKVYQEHDTSDEYRSEVMADILDKLDAFGALARQYSKSVMPAQERLRVLYSADSAPLRKSKLRDNIDRIRAVHAEGAALLDCARHGVGCIGTTMYTTTFPCHECARHIVVAGIKKVVYLEPYPKSDTQKLYDDSIMVDPTSSTDRRWRIPFCTFVGVAPPRFLEFFFVAGRERKDAEGTPLTFPLGPESAPRLPYYTPSPEAVTTAEFRDLPEFKTFLLNHHFAPQSQKEADHG